MSRATLYWLIGIGAVVLVGGYVLMQEAKKRGMNSAQLLKGVTQGTIKPASPLPTGPGGVKYIADQGF